MSKRDAEKIAEMLVMCEILARMIAGTHEPVIISLFASEPMTELDRSIYGISDDTDH